MRFRRVETIVEAALESYRNTGYNEISLLSLSTSDYPQFADLVRRLQETFRPLGVNISVPSLRVNEQWRTIGELLTTDRHSGLTLAPEVARILLNGPESRLRVSESPLQGYELKPGFQRKSNAPASGK